MINRTEIPESVGLMYYDPEKKTITTRKKAIYRKIEYSLEMLLYIIFSRLDSDRYPFFSDKQEYFEAYLAGKSDNRVLGHAVKTALVKDNARLENELEHLREFERQYEAHKAIMDVLHKHHIWGYRSKDIGDELDKALSSKCPDDISDIRRNAERLAERLRAVEARGGKEEGAP